MRIPMVTLPITTVQNCSPPFFWEDLEKWEVNFRGERRCKDFQMSNGLACERPLKELLFGFFGFFFFFS